MTTIQINDNSCFESIYLDWATQIIQTFLFESELFNCVRYFKVNITGEPCYFLRLTIPNKWFDIIPMAKESLLT